VRENDPPRLPAGQLDQHRHHLSRRRRSCDLVAKSDGRVTFRAIADERLHGRPNAPGRWASLVSARTAPAAVNISALTN
jgi:hypothetical protein